MNSNHVTSTNLPPYNPVSEITKDETKENVYYQNVESNGHTYKVTIHFTKGSNPSDVDIQKHMNDQIAKLVVLANKMGLGNADNELNKIKASREKGITGVWHDSQGNKRSNNLIKEKTTELEKIEILPENAGKIDTLRDQIDFLKRMTDLFKATLPPQQSQTNPHPLTALKAQPENQTFVNQERSTSSSSTSSAQSKRSSNQNDPQQSSLLQSQIKDVGLTLSQASISNTNKMPSSVINRSSSLLSQRGVDSALDRENPSPDYESLSSNDELRSISTGDDFPQVDNADIQALTIRQSESIRNILPGFDSRVFSEFNQNLVDANHLANRMNILEIKKNQRTLELNLDAYEQLSMTAPSSAENEIEMQSLSQKSPSEIRRELQSQSYILKDEFDSIQKIIANKLEESLVKMTQNYNKAAEHLTELKKNPASNQEAIQYLEKKMESKQRQIADCNAFACQHNLPTNEFTATKAKVYEIAAVVEKKLDLMEQLAIRDQKAKDNYKFSFKENQEYKHINKVLKKAPEADIFQNKCAQVYEQLEKVSNISSVENAKVNHKSDPELEWGTSHLNLALTQPSNWTNVHSALIKISKAGNAFVSVTKNEPLNINETGGVPSSLRAKKGFDTRATNLIKTTTYLRGRNSSEIEVTPIYGEQMSFRGGQFPTVTAAKEAIEQIMLSLPPGRVLEDLHINALLTPIMFTFMKEDKLLLSEHKKNIFGALDELLEQELENRSKSITKLKDNLIISNFGVNEGAVGEISFLTHRIKAGWHESIDKYSNEASQDLNKSLKSKLENILENPSIDDLDHLGALLQVGHEIEAIWANNDYAEGRAGNNQFKMPALWKIMDGLTDRITYTNCMSGKDRTGEVESNAQYYRDEIEMNIADRKKDLNAKFDQLSNELGFVQDYKDLWDKNRGLLTAACFSENELDKLKITLLTENYRFEDSVKTLIDKKIRHVHEGLGLHEGGLLKEKEMVLGGLFNIDTDGISTNIPKIVDNTYNAHRNHLPNVMTDSIYQNQLNTYSLPSEDMTLLENNQRLAINKKLSLLSGSLSISQMNTGKSGFKMNVGEPLARTSAGFDRDYVLSQIKKTISNVKLTNNAEAKKMLLNDFIRWTNLDDLGVDAKNEYGKRFLESALDSTVNDELRNKKLTALLKEIEVDKMIALTPKAKVKG